MLRKNHFHQLALTALFSILSCPYVNGLAQSTSPYAQEAAEGVTTLQQWYVQSSGFYQSPTGWWNTANAITLLVNYSRVTGTTQYLPAVANTYANANAVMGSQNFISSANDDEGWWALAWIDAYDLTRNQNYLNTAESYFPT